MRGLTRSLLVGGAAAVLLLAASPGVHVQASPAAQTTSAWTGEYFANPDLQGEPAFERSDADISFDWGDRSPGDGISEDGFSVRWTRWVYADTAGPWTLAAIADDGVRVFVDDNLAIDAWYDQPVTAHTATVNLTQAYHLIRMEYYKRNSPAQAHLVLSSASFPDWRGEYFDNPDLVGEPAFMRNDSAIDFDFGSAGPGGDVPGTDFSARWTSSRHFRRVSIHHDDRRWRASLDRRSSADRPVARRDADELLGERSAHRGRPFRGDGILSARQQRAGEAECGVRAGSGRVARRLFCQRGPAGLASIFAR
ncbi:MAG: PA14 domain-containing protein [Chloroflexi bacterium]|nr:PA14 domain-containing protein [Chloroflexota bacterium]